MKQIFTYIMLFTSLCGSSQQKIDPNKMMKELEQGQKKLDSVMEASRRRLDSLNMEQFKKQNERNLNAFMAEQQERQRKQKRANWLRIGFGVAMLAVLGIGLARKKKKSVQ